LLPPEPIYDLAHLAHLEMLTPKPEASLQFFVDVMGMTETARQGDSVYLRGWDDYEHHTLKLTASKTSGMKHMAFRARSPQALERRVAALQSSGYEIGWSTAIWATARRLPFTIRTGTGWKFIMKPSGTRRRRN
jgi:catechol 2,3-dioxygenase